MRYIGLDVGKKNIGVAVGEILATEVETLKAPKNSDFYSPTGIALVAKQLQAIISKEDAGSIVAGLPVDENGNETEESALIKQFCSELGKLIKLPIEFVDETLTSFMAADMLEEQGCSQNEIDKKVHQMAAALILQQYLEEKASA